MCKSCDDAIADALAEEHPCDDEHGCDVVVASDRGWLALAACLLSSATECPETDKAVGAAVGRHGLDAWNALVEKQRGYLAHVSHLACPHCNSVCYEPDDVDDCPNCGKSLDSWFVIPVTITGEYDYSHQTIVIFRAKCRETAEGPWTTSGSLMELVADGDPAIWGRAIVDAYDRSNFETDGLGAVYNVRSCDCGEPDCRDHEALSVCARWEPGGWKAFATREAAEAHARAEYGDAKFVNAD